MSRTAVKSQWEGRLGVELVGEMGGCCARAILKWRPQVIGQRHSCAYCGATMKTVRAGEGPPRDFRGTLNETRIEAQAPDLVVGGLFFSSEKFASPERANAWMADRDIAAKAELLDMHAHYALVKRLAPDTARAVWAAPGVIAEVGVAEGAVAEKQGAAATGGGQASMHSPGITTVSMAAGGTAHPAQGPAATVVGSSGAPPVITGVTESNDGHQHEFSLVPFPANDGWRVKGYTSFNNGHAHFIEAALEPDGALDTRTTPDQAPVGGHAHAHRIVWRTGMSASPMKEAQAPAFVGAGREYVVTSHDAVLLRRAAGLVKNFCQNLANGRGGVMEHLAADMGGFQERLSAAIERARGQVAHREGAVFISGADLQKLDDCGRFVGAFGERVAGSLGMEKGCPGTSEAGPATTTPGEAHATTTPAGAAGPLGEIEREVAAGEVEKAKKGRSRLVKPSGEFVGGFGGCVEHFRQKKWVKNPESLCAHIGRAAGKI